MAWLGLRGWGLRGRIRRRLGFLKRRLVKPPWPQAVDRVVRVHIGCGPVNAPGFINVDAQPYPHVHVVTERIEELSFLDDGTADLIYASHVVEHIPGAELARVLEGFRRKLKPGGVLRLSVPDFDGLLAIYTDNDRDIAVIANPLMGGQRSRFDFHCSVFTRRSLTALLTAAGFRNVRDWRPEAVRHHEFEDTASQPYVVRGKAYAHNLNLEADA